MNIDWPDRLAQFMELVGALSLAVALVAIGWDVSSPQEPTTPASPVALVQAPSPPSTSAHH